MERARAYDDRGRFLTNGQTLSQPYMWAWIEQSLALPGPNAVGDGRAPGSRPEILATLAKEVYTVNALNFSPHRRDRRLEWAQTYPLLSAMVAGCRSTRVRPHHRDDASQRVPIALPISLRKVEFCRSLVRPRTAHALAQDQRRDERAARRRRHLREIDRPPGLTRTEASTRYPLLTIPFLCESGHSESGTHARSPSNPARRGVGVGFGPVLIGNWYALAPEH